MKDRFIEVFGENIVNIIINYPQLECDDINEIQNLEIKKIFAVYDNWEEIAIEHMRRAIYNEYIIPFINIKELSKYIEDKESNEWIKLKSGKLICIK